MAPTSLPKMDTLAMALNYEIACLSLALCSCIVQVGSFLMSKESAESILLSERKK